MPTGKWESGGGLLVGLGVRHVRIRVLIEVLVTQGGGPALRLEGRV